jgi:hypothetical protein
MTAGQAHTTWFPELKNILKTKWRSNLSIEQQFGLVNELTEKLKQIRTELNIQLPMMWCPKCKKRQCSKFTDVSITAMYYALKKFEFCQKDEFNMLLGKWKKYSKSENIDIFGNEKTDKSLVCSND